jgi:hypothetical protein
MQHLLTSKTGVSMSFDPELGEAVGPMIHSTDLRYSSFLKPGTDTGVEPARKPISGIIACGFGCSVWREGTPVRGVLHPDAARPFPRRLLPRIRFCELVPGYETGGLSPRWT